MRKFVSSKLSEAVRCAIKIEKVGLKILKSKIFHFFFHFWSNFSNFWTCRRNFFILPGIRSKIVCRSAMRNFVSSKLSEAVRCAIKIEEVGLKILKSVF